jgi:hypothetical protein
MVAMALANRCLDPAQARQRWFKYGTYLGTPEKGKSTVPQLVSAVGSR